MVLQSACIDLIGPVKLSRHFMSATSTGNIYVCVSICVCVCIHMCMWEHVVCLTLSQTWCVSVLLRNPLIPSIISIFLMAWHDNNCVKVRKQEAGLGWIKCNLYTFLHHVMQTKEKFDICKRVHWIFFRP